MTTTATFTVIATTTCYAGHTNEVEAHTILEDGSPLFGGAYHLCRTCDERNQIHLASFRKVEMAA